MRSTTVGWLRSVCVVRCSHELTVPAQPCDARTMSTRTVKVSSAPARKANAVVTQDRNDLLETGVWPERCGLSIAIGVVLGRKLHPQLIHFQYQKVRVTRGACRAPKPEGSFRGYDCN